MKFDNNSLLFYNAGGGIEFILETNKIYKCSVLHNVIPFATDPSNNSWCGVGFPYGARDVMTQINVKNIYFNVATNSECIHMARAFQKTL